MAKNLRARPWARRPLSGEVLSAAMGHFTEFQARLLASRLATVPSRGIRAAVYPEPQDLPKLSNLPDIGAATAAIVEAIESGAVVGICCDHDCDGVSSSSVIWTALQRFGVPKAKLQIITSHRLREGYGVSSKLVERILSASPRPSLVITADQGSTDEPRIHDLARYGIRVVVSDHHTIPEEGPPKSAIACVNPARQDSTFGDPTIAGCMVAWLIMESVRRSLVEKGRFQQGQARIDDLVEFAAVGTMCDCVDLGASAANRWVVQRGLARISQEARPIWKAFSLRSRRPWTSETCSFFVGPRINAASRVGDAARAVSALCAPDIETAQMWVDLLEEANTERKQIQARLVEQALDIATPLVEDGAMGLCIPFYDGGHPGVAGIVASRIVETTGLPCVCLSLVEGEPGRMTGSIRSVPGVHVRQVLEHIAAEHPEFGLMFGGHAAAGGVRMAIEQVPAFAVAWDVAVGEAMEASGVEPRFHDGPIGVPLHRDLIAQMDALQPYGRGFPEPIFCDDIQIEAMRLVGRERTHLRLDARWPDGRSYRAMLFNGADLAATLRPGPARAVYRIAPSDYSLGPGFDIHIQELMVPE